MLAKIQSFDCKYVKKHKRCQIFLLVLSASAAPQYSPVGRLKIFVHHSTPNCNRSAAVMNSSFVSCLTELAGEVLKSIFKWYVKLLFSYLTSADFENRQFWTKQHFMESVHILEVVTKRPEKSDTNVRDSEDEKFIENKRNSDMKKGKLGT